MPVLNLPRGTRGCFQGVISSCNNITFAVTPATILWSSKLLFFSPQPCTGFSLPNRVLCWRQCGTVIWKVHSFLYLSGFLFGFSPCCNQSVSPRRSGICDVPYCPESQGCPYLVPLSYLLSCLLFLMWPFVCKYPFLLILVQEILQYCLARGRLFCTALA